MRKTFELALLKMMEINKKVILLTADDESAELTLIQEKIPERFIRVGIAEQNLVGIACGLSRLNFIPVVYTYGSFIVHRALDFLRCDVCINKYNVKLVGWGSGVKVNNYGPSHHTTEDISILRTMPNLTLLTPASQKEVDPILKEAINSTGPVYIRLGKAFETEIFNEIPEFKIGKSRYISEGTDITFISTGNIIANVIEASRKLENHNFKTCIVNLSSIKPFDRNLIIDSINKTKKVITVEEHQITGGIGSLVSEVIAEEGLNCKFKRMGFNDKFATEFGWHKDILEENGLSALSIYSEAKKMLGVEI